jgi:signal peptidase
VIRRLLLGAAVSVVLFTVGIVGLGWKPYVVTSESMSPALHAGDLILVDPQATSLAVYEIVTYADPRGLVTHRVVAQAEDGTFTVRGDANLRADARPVERRQVIGPVRLILPHIGWPVVQVRTHPFKVAGGALILALVWPRRRLLRIVVLGGLVAVVAMVPTTGARPVSGVAAPEFHPAPVTSGLLRPGGDLTIGGGALAHRTAGGLPDRLQLLPGARGAVLRARHPGDGLLHQGAADVVGAAVEHRHRALVAELHP